MLFVSLIKNLPGKYAHAIKILKHPRTPPGVEVKLSLGLFGEWDSVIVFEAETEQLASEFTIQFGEVGDVCTSLAVSVDELKWTQ